MRAAVIDKERLTPSIFLFKFAVSSDDFVPARAGSHVPVRISEEVVRSYSLTRAAAVGANQYEVAVRRGDADGSASRQLCDFVAAGHTVEVNRPGCHFELDATAKHHVLVAGGIGVTPLLAMARHLWQSQASFECHFAFASPEETPFLAELRGGPWSNQCQLYFSRSSTPNRLRIAELIAGLPVQAVVYVCGPQTMIEETRFHCSERGRQVRFERFEPVVVSGEEGDGYTVVLKRAGVSFVANAMSSLLEQVVAHGGVVASSCRNGTCGTCVSPVLAGDIVHQDSCLYPEEQAAGDRMALCVSRGRKGTELVLDI